MKLIGYFFTTIVLVVYASILNGLALTKLWSWFIVKTFELPPLSIPEAIGLSTVVAYLTHQLDDKKNEDEYWQTLTKGFAVATAKSIFALLFGWVVQLWI